MLEFARNHPVAGGLILGVVLCFTPVFTLVEQLLSLPLKALATMLTALF